MQANTHRQSMSTAMVFRSVRPPGKTAPTRSIPPACRKSFSFPLFSAQTAPDRSSQKYRRSACCKPRATGWTHRKIHSAHVRQREPAKTDSAKKAGFQKPILLFLRKQYKDTSHSHCRKTGHAPLHHIFTNETSQIFFIINTVIQKRHIIFGGKRSVPNKVMATGKGSPPPQTPPQENSPGTGKTIRTHPESCASKTGQNSKRPHTET